MQFATVILTILFHLLVGLFEGLMIALGLFALLVLPASRKAQV